MLPNNTSVFVQAIIYIMNQSAIQEEDTSYNYYYLDIDNGNNFFVIYKIVFNKITIFTI